MHSMTSMWDCISIVLGYKGHTMIEKFTFPLKNSFLFGGEMDSRSEKNNCEVNNYGKHL